MINMFRKNGLLVVVTIVLITALISVTVTKRTHRDIVINANGKEYIVDSYSKHNDCIIFDYDGKTKTICGNFEIIE